MKMCLVILLICVKLCFSEQGLLQLSEDNFDQATSSGRWILEFFAPWCPHCQHLMPVLMKTQETLKNEGLDLKIAVIDCTVEKSLCSRYHVTGYPTLKYCTLGRVSDYPGSREMDDFLNFGRKLKLPATNDYSDTQALPQNQISFVLISSVLKDKELFERCAEILRTHQHLAFYKTSNSDAKKKFKFSDDDLIEKSGSVLIAIKDDPSGHVDVLALSNINEETMLKWMENNSYLIYPQLSYDNFKHVVYNGKMTVMALLDDTDLKHKVFKDLMNKVALTYKHNNNFSFGWLDAPKFSRFLSQYDISNYPSVVVIKVNEEIHFVKELGEYREEDVIRFLEDIQSNKVEPLGPGSGLYGRIKSIYKSIMWQVTDHPYIFLSVFSVFVIFFVVICYFDFGDDGEDEEMIAAAKSKTRKQD